MTVVLVLFFMGTFYSFSGSRGEKRLNFLLITIDTLRADRLSCYDSGNVKTPNIDMLAEKGVVFTRAFANTSTTLPSHSNILLGVSPLYHGVHENSYFVVREELLTLAEHLKHYGYSTGAFVGAFPLERRFGLDQGFDAYDDSFERKNFEKLSSAEKKAEVVVQNALQWLRKQESPWFLWIHCWDPHEPYEPPQPFKSEYEKNPYDGEVAYVDSVLGGFFNFLSEKKLFQDTLVILTGDHGESLGEHGEKTHGMFAYNSTLWIPLIVVSPGVRSGRVGEYVSHVDIFPTVCDLLQLKKPSFLQGRSLLPALKGKKMASRPIYFESLYPYYSKGWAPIRGYIHKKIKFIESPVPELYDLEQDFAELNNLAAKEKLKAYRKELEKIINHQKSPLSAEAERMPDKETVERLRSLGYIAGTMEERKESFSRKDDVKVLLPYLNKAHQALNRYEEGFKKIGVEMLKEIITERKDIDDAYINLAYLYKREGRVGDAVEVMKIAHQNLPSNYMVFYTYLNYLVDAAQYDAVIQAFNDELYRHIQFDPEIWNIVGIAFFRKGEFKRAIEMYTHALQLDPDSPVKLTNLGEAQLYLSHREDDKKLFQQCMENFKRAIELDPDYPFVYNALGKALRGEGNLDEAVNAFERALELNPNIDESLYLLGLTYLEKGEKNKALSKFTLYKERYYYFLPDSLKKKLDELIERARK